MQSLLKAFVAGLALVASQAGAQGYPTKPVHAIISFTPGSSTDIVGRIVMQKVSEYWGQPVVAENRAGAGGSIGSREVAAAAPDGYTLLVNSTAHAVNPAIYAKLPYDTLKDFIDIAPLAMQPNVLVVAGTSPIKSVADLIAAAKAKPGRDQLRPRRNRQRHAPEHGEIHFRRRHPGHAGALQGHARGRDGPARRIGGLLLGADLGRHVEHPERQAAPARGQQREAQPAAAGGSDHRRSGCGQCEFPLWFGLWAPAGTPADIVNKISADVRRALADPGVREKLANLGNDPMDMPPEEFARFVRSEIEDYARVVKAAGIKPQ